LTLALEGVRVRRQATATLLPEKTLHPWYREAGWASGPVWTGAENLTSQRDSIPGPSSL